MLSDFLQELVCTCKRRSVCSKGCVCFELNLSCTELCLCQALDLCHNVITNRTDIEDDDASFDLVNRTWRYSGNQINTVVFMICLKKEILRAYASSSSISVLFVITLWQRSNAQTPNLIIIGFRITMVNKTCIFCGFKPSKCLKGCFYLRITLIKKLQGFTWDVQCS
jgi:hypothetical protein